MRSSRGSSPVGAALVLLTLVACDAYDTGLLNAADRWREEQALCGNGRIDEGESCDVAVAGGAEGACPGECTTEDPCEHVVLAGSGCYTECVSLPITRAQNDDGCCPPGMGAVDDSDCGSCGDGIVGPGEECDPSENCPSQQACTQHRMCVVGIFTGDTAECTARCTYQEITDCLSGDDCCPVGCDSTSDGDCSATCGNGIVELQAGETCEPGSVKDPCPQSCDDGQACTLDLRTGSPENCNVECTHAVIQSAVSGDGCCPIGQNAIKDSDCLPECGNNVVESGESCDPCPGSCDDGDPCTIDERSGSGCGVICSRTTIDSPSAGDACCPKGASSLDDSDCPPACGNLVLEAGEECDGGAQCDSDCKRVLVRSANFGSTAGTAFEDIGAIGSRITKLNLHAGWWIDSLQLVTSSQTFSTHGSTAGGNSVTATVPSGQYLVRIYGVYGDDKIGTIRFVTNAGTVLGPYGTGQEANAGGSYDYSVPAGNEIVGFSGRASDRVAGIGVVSAKH
jgi:hypothetical protein